ncbi:ADP-ribose pyrophosphatase YjhB, NUDIX family [Nocardia amikacinitolerans]|uniref:ADP-ribose pyrophosphatase YjhB, NUDIX family n=1 Tax=Nocardia amikacinitolerans TaxID=756689 RepID=A0A285M0P4_9NOCA|nr:NUDIX hydrolase [Nocardia amikacinitolerans]SNY89111.1 ADP-ribose pyrophosphatase YjhB, NUDIX family [Nocardia amikacinitolerans]
MTEGSDEFAQARMAAGALFVRGDDVLLVHKTYGDGWDVPGGYVEPGESPAAACRREVREELGIDRLPRRLLVLDWAPHPGEGDKILYLFDCGELGDERVILQAAELDRWEWVAVDELDDYVVPRLARRIRQARIAHVEGSARYLEHGEPAPSFEPRG